MAVISPVLLEKRERVPFVDKNQAKNKSKTGRAYRKHLVQFSKFLIVGMMNTAIGYSIFALFTLLGFGPSIALVLTYVVGVPVNYMTTGRLVFDSSRLRSFAFFLMSYIAIYCVNFGALTLLMQYQISQLLAQAILVPFIAVLSFVIFKTFVFRNP
jgi:putative flippase GtrA